MKTLNLKLDYKKLNLADKDKEKHCSEFILNVIENIIISYAQQCRGISEKERKQYYRISKVFDKAKVEKLESIELDDEYIGFIRKCFKEAKLVPNELLKQVEELLEQVKNR